MKTSVAHSCQTLRNPVDCSRPGLPVHHQLPEFTETHVHRVPSSHLILCRPLLLPPSIFPRIRVFSSDSALCIRCSEYWSFSISPSNEYSGLISSRMDWLDLLAVQGTLKSHLQQRQFGANRKLALILSQQRGEQSRFLPQGLCPAPYEGSSAPSLPRPLTPHQAP